MGARPGFAHGYKPGYVAIRNLDIRNCHASRTFGDIDGTTKPYGMVGAGIYLERCDNVTVAGCAVHDNGEGIFGTGQSDFDRIMTDITIEANRIWGNGNVGRDREHNSYVEAIDVVYQFNRYGPLRPGALGAGLKDRSAGTVIRFNWIEGGAHQLQIPEAQNQADLAVTLPRYRRTIVEGNTLVAPAGNGASLIWFGVGPELGDARFGADGDYRLAAGSNCIDAAGRLPARVSAWPVTSQFLSPAGGMARPMVGAAPDLGAFEAGAVAIPPPAPPPTLVPAPSSPPAAPTNLRAAALAASQVRLTWTDRSRNETGFVVDRRQSGRGWIRVVSTAANVTTFIDTTAIRGVIYAYRVRAAGVTSAGPGLSAPTATTWVRTPLRSQVVNAG